MLKKVGAELILTVIILPFFIWVTTSIFDLKAQGQTTDFAIKTIQSDTQEIKADVKGIINIMLKEDENERKIKKSNRLR